ncbi:MULTISPECIES: FAD-binding oxidoreductase [unclassified Bradyrhizobium]|uniref:NAD(P)/FAD-dependent oxidoreductase n=1 Tax=unclassified Bradyrhizobium TaxID=2631580 RepID=UPI001FF93913|nr:MULTISPECIES: FAD-binding oxidoreductase [unclassified Bradyrhizobium]MCK1348705.1 FAD-binding oxidoreductase [Bradyrhizobium sp. CW11]MCK1700407.1 FAD-binding oxidoreductase [Bradyrhizobium sp. 146]
MKSAIVLGAGMVGVATAIHLQRRNWSVALLDVKEPGSETSYGNAGIIQNEALRPYPMPHNWREIAKIATGRTNDVRYRLAALPYHLDPLFRYWWHSFPARHARASAAYAQIITCAAREHEHLIRESGAGRLIRREGFRVLHRQQAMLDAAVLAAEALRDAHGVRFNVMTSRELKEAEPALADAGIGGLHWLESWTVSDPGALVSAYASLFARSGGCIFRGEAQSLLETSGGGWSAATSDGRIEAETAVVALGPWSPDFLKRFGCRFLMVRKRGYHRHYAGGSSLDLPLCDEADGYVLAPMTKGMRITTGAELAQPDGKLDLTQLAHAEKAARKLMDLGQPVEAEPWLGTRPCMPDMLPVIGRAPGRSDLWLHFGHGHQGFTLGPVTGRLLAELMSNEAPMVDPHPYRPERY